MYFVNLKSNLALLYNKATISKKCFDLKNSLKTDYAAYTLPFWHLLIVVDLHPCLTKATNIKVKKIMCNM